jgi:MarR family transcriptional regulator, organic hydroperoxide resistance regulator
MAEPSKIASKTPPVLERQVRELDACFEAFRRDMIRSMAPPATDVELSPQDGRALVTLGDRGRMTMTDFAELLGAPLSTATRMVERLIHKGLATRSRIEDDRRVVHVELSDEGKKLNQIFLERRREIAGTMLAPLTHGEREIFIELMTKITRPSPQE